MFLKAKITCDISKDNLQVLMFVLSYYFFFSAAHMELLQNGGVSFFSRYRVHVRWFNRAVYSLAWSSAILHYTISRRPLAFVLLPAAFHERYVLDCNFDEQK